MSSSTPPAGEGQMPPAAGQTTGQTPATGQQTLNQPPPSSEDDQPLSAAKARELREENKQRRLAYEQLQAELKKVKDSQLSEEQRKEQRLAELEKQNAIYERQRQEWAIDRAVLLTAPQVGINPELAQKLIDLAEIDTDTDGNPKAASVKKALEKLLECYPQLAVSPTQAQGQPGQQRPPAPRVAPTNPPASSVGNQPQYSFKNRPGWGAVHKQQQGS